MDRDECISILLARLDSARAETPDFRLQSQDDLLRVAQREVVGLILCLRAERGTLCGSDDALVEEVCNIVDCPYVLDIRTEAGGAYITVPGIAEWAFDLPW